MGAESSKRSTTVAHVFPGWMCSRHVDPAQPLTMAGEKQDDFDHDLADTPEV